MKLAQFKTSESAEQRLGVLMGAVVYDVAASQSDAGRH